MICKKLLKREGRSLYTMEPSNRINLSNQIIDDPNIRYCEIYKITNIASGKLYVGQALSHILNHKRYRPHGREGRFRCHISEAFSSKQNQSHYLNNAIRKYGVTNFSVELLECCEIVDADTREIHYIKELNTLFPNGYNLKNGGTTFTHCDESKKRVSDGVARYFKDKKFQRFAGVSCISDDIHKYIHPLNREKTQYGWYVLIDKKKADFGGVHIPLSESRKSAEEFIRSLKQNISNMTKLRETPLEPSLPLTSGNGFEELG
jgi:group I intron endonuclease